MIKESSFIQGKSRLMGNKIKVRLFSLNKGFKINSESDQFGSIQKKIDLNPGRPRIVSCQCLTLADVTSASIMAKKLLYQRVFGPKVFWPAVFEDISDDEADCEPIDYSKSTNSKDLVMDLTCKTEDARDVKQEKVDLDYFTPNIKTEPVEEEISAVGETSDGLDEKLLMEWSEDPGKEEAGPDQTFIALLNRATFVLDCSGEGRKTPEKLSPSKPEERPAEQFDCELCSRKYWKKSKLETHMRSQHARKEKMTRSPDDKRSLISQCPECRDQLENKTEMFVHRLTHLLPSFAMMSCPLCREDQHSFNKLKQHMRSGHQVREKWFCPICPDGRTFTQNHSLLAHISTFHFDASKTAPTQYPCDKCQKLFTSKALLGKHIQNDHGGLIEKGKKCGKLMACYICQKKMEDLTQLRRHLINHNEHKFGRQSTKIKTEEFSAKYLEFSRKYFKAQKPSFSISSILSKA